MKFGDRILQKWRINKAARWICKGARLLDIGCADGAIFSQLQQKISSGIGVDPDIESGRELPNGRLVPGYFPDAIRDEPGFDAITMLAVLEHIPPDKQTQLAKDISHYLIPGGKLIVTVPSPLVDHILSVLKFLRLVDGMSLEEHYGFEPKQTPSLFQGAGLKLVSARRFQLGLNYLFVLEKPLANAA